MKRLIVSIAFCSIIAVAVAVDAQDKAAGNSVTGADAGASKEFDWFETHIRPVLVEHCYECHSSKSKVVQGGLRLDTAHAVQSGGESGPLIDSDQPGDSLLLSALRYESYEMPPKGKLPEETIALFEQWIHLGTPDPRVDSSEMERVSTEATHAKDHWSFQPPVRQIAPKMTDDNWSRSDVDRFILAKLKSERIVPSSQASGRTLLRRVYYDLTGLPPTADQLDSFLADPSDSHYESIVDSLLASEQFGERWGRYWLDVARYADTKGYVLGEDRDYNSAFKYRDWVVQCFNSDRPYDEFVQAQIAADRLGREADKVASGFLTLGPRFVNKRHHIINDRIDVISRGLMGLTVVCARCHDHKYDPISTADYYALYGVFASSDEERPDDAPPILVDKDKPRDAAIFVRGDPKNLGPTVQRHFLTCLSNGDPIPFQDGSGRRELSDAIASAENPLTARVWVNRVWANLFGRGIVATTSDFGVRGDKPTHPALLDWLACTFVDEGWSTKRLVRRLVLSSVYRQASADRDDCLNIDPENHLLWRMNRKRLDLEALRDSLLFAAGHLDLDLGGPSVELTEAPYPTRRSIYGFVERQNMPSFFRTFDFANPNAHSGGRPHTVTPQRALYLMNSPFILQQAKQTAARSHVSRLNTDDGTLDQNATSMRLKRLFRFALSRNPSAQESAWATEFLQGDFKESPKGDRTPVNPWQFGWGTIAESSERVDFHVLPHFTGSAWQGAMERPDAKLGWVMLSAKGGHPGNAGHAAIRRFVVPVSGALRISGDLIHKNDDGDGVRARIVHSRKGVVASWIARDAKVDTEVEDRIVQAGDFLDFVVDCRDSTDHDSFTWSPTITISQESNQETTWRGSEGFQGPLPPSLSGWEQLAHSLLMSNEFVFVD